MSTHQFDTLRLREYTDSDFTACTELFESNSPKYFAKSELKEFQTFLKDSGPTNYWVAMHPKEKLVGAGGLVRISPTEGRLRWGMVRSDLFQKGIGSVLLVFRLQQLFNNGKVTHVQLSTSQRTPLFFARWGFSTEQVKENHYARGLHCYEMRLALPEDERPVLTGKLAKFLEAYKFPTT